MFVSNSIMDSKHPLGVKCQNVTPIFIYRISTTPPATMTDSPGSSVTQDQQEQSLYNLIDTEENINNNNEKENRESPATESNQMEVDRENSVDMEENALCKLSLMETNENENQDEWGNICVVSQKIASNFYYLLHFGRCFNV